MTFHPAQQAAVSLPARLFDEAPAQRESEDDREQHDHHQAAGELRGQELPAEKDEEHEAELKDQVG